MTLRENIQSLSQLLFGTSTRGHRPIYGQQGWETRRDRAFDPRDYYDAGGADPWRTAIQASIDAAQDNGGGRIFIPEGTYPLLTSTNVSSLIYQLVVTGDNITIEFAPGAKITSTIASARPLVVIGAGKPTGIANWASNEFRDVAGHALTGTQTKGSRTLTLATAGDAANYATNDYVSIATGQTLASSTNEPDSEINQVIAVDAVAGTITLRWPLLATYQQENYNSGSSGVSSVGGGGTSAPFVVRKISDRIIRNFRMINPQFECLSGTLQVVSLWQGINARIDDGLIVHNYLGLGSRDWRNCELTTNFDHRDDGSAVPYWIAPSTGCSNWSTDAICTSDGGAIWHAHEGVKSARWRGELHCANVGSGESMIDFRARVYDMDVDCDLYVHAATAVNVVSVDNLCVGGGTIAARVNADSGGGTASIRVDAPNWIVDGSRTNFGRVSLRAAQLGSGQNSESRFLSGWVTSTNTTVTLGILPQGAVVVNTPKLRVRTAFDSDGTDLLTIGYDTAPSAYITAADVSTTGVKSPVAGGGVMVADETTDRTVKAYYTAGGSAPTTGEALVIVEYIMPARRD